MKIIIGADLVPTKSNYNEFINADIGKLLNEDLKKLLNNADYRIFNLEVPLTDEKKPIAKCGPNLIAPTDTINGIKKIGVDLVTLANNHIMDQDEQGLRKTIDVLKKNDISYLGAGENLKEASKPYIIENDKKIGIYACAEHEFSIAQDDKAGANPIDVFESFNHIKQLKEKCDYVIVLYHGGKEHYRYPSPNLQKVCRKIAEAGADLIITQHSHCIGCKEEYNASTIIYGQGNFLFDNSESEFWRTSLLVSVDSDDFKIGYIPLEKCGNAVKMAEKDEILNGFFERSEQIKKSGFLENEYKRFAAEMKETYMNNIYGVNIIWRILNKLCGHRLKKRISRKRLLALENFIECEAHRELILKGIKDEK